MEQFVVLSAAKDDNVMCSISALESVRRSAARIEHQHLRVGRDAFLPHRLGDDAEHGATVETLPTGLQRVDARATEEARFVERGGCRHVRNLATKRAAEVPLVARVRKNACR